MIAKGCEEKMLTYRSTKELEQELEELRMSLQNAFSEYESNKELVRNPRVWVEYIKNAIDRAICFRALRKDYPEMDDIFDRLEASLQRVNDGRLIRYAKK